MNKGIFNFIFLLLFFVAILQIINANSYFTDIYFTVPDTVYTTNQQIEIKGFIYQSNYSSNGSLVLISSPLASAIVNLTMRNSSGANISIYNFTTDSNGTFYSKSNYYSSAIQINASSTAGNYYLRAEYIGSNNLTGFSEIEITVINKTIDILRISSEKAKYNPSESVKIEIEAVKMINDRTIYISNISVNGTLRNSSKTTLSSFNCTTGDNGKCIVSLTAPTNYGDYILELNNFKTIGAFSVIPFSTNVYMKDNLGKSLKNVFAISEQGRVEVGVTNATSTDLYTFSGYIADSSGNNIKTITSTELNNNNSFTNSFLFTLDSLTFSYGAYLAYVTITKTGDGSISSTTSFEVKDWVLSVNKKEINSGFEYGYSIFSNQTMNFEVYPTYRSNGSIIGNLTAFSFTSNLKDNLNNVISTTNASWNSSCGKEGCYEFSLNSPLNIGEYVLSTTLSYSGNSQVETRVINVIDGIISAQSTDKDGNLKELFGTNEYSYISLTSYNLTSSGFNLTNAEIFIVEYMNGTEFSYTQTSNFDLVNSSNSVYEWAWNVTSQRIKLDVPKIGGLYNVILFGNNQTIGTNTKFIVNPYDVCSIPKDTPGTVSSGNYYVWQFKTTDTIYFELQLTQANNPLGRATAQNVSGNGTGASSSGCNVDTTTKQVVNNATISVVEVKNIGSGAIQAYNITSSTCQADDSSGGYTCTVEPLSKWDGGINIVKFNVASQDGTTDIIYSRFESRAFYLYGWSQTWQNSPTSNVTLNIQLYEAGSGWWGSSGGLSGTVTLKKIEYQGSDGDWLSTPIDYAYNVSNLSAATITSGTGSISVPVSKAPGGQWKTGYYRAVLQGTTTGGDTDYGYAWFGVKLWDVYGQPVECSASSCQYKNYFNSKENVTLYVKISQAGSYSYNYQGGQDIGGNVTISVKKIKDCRTWPCKELNSSTYIASSIVVNSSSPWYWNANINNQSNYLIQINTTTGSWGTGYYSVVLDVNGTDTGSAWFNTIAFYVDTKAVDSGGTNSKYSIKPSEQMYFNVTTTKNYKGWGAVYNASDFINATIDSVVLRTWNQQTWESIEYNYPGDINITPNNLSGNALFNLSFNNGSWPTGYYNGELTLRSSDNETSTGWLSFDVKPFRVAISTNTYSVDVDQCVNATLNIYEPNWYSSTLLTGNYSIDRIYEDIWSGSSRSQTVYSNYTNVSFSNSTNLTICPDNESWGSGSWGGYHYLNIVVKDNADNSTQNGWLSFKAVPFQVSWGSIYGGTSKLTNANVVIPVTLAKYSSGANTTGNLTEIYQWRYDNYQSTRETYVFSVGSCYSNVTSQCTVNGTQNVTVYPPTGGWKVGYNYLYAMWSKQDDASSTIQDWSGISFDGREALNGYFSNSDANSYWKYDFRDDENITIKLYVRDSNYNNVDANITSIQYALSGDSCWSDWCRSYTTATWSLTDGGINVGSDGNAIITISPPAADWSQGYYYIKATVSSSAGTATIKEGNIRVKDMVAPNVSISSPTVNQSITGATFSFTATTTESANCYLSLLDYGSFYSWNCGGISNSSNSTTNQMLVDSCNTTFYGFDNSTDYYYEYISKDYLSVSSGANYDYWWKSGSTGMVTDGTTHSYTLNTTNKVTGSNLTDQDYGVQVWCYDSDWNSGTGYSAFNINLTG